MAERIRKKRTESEKRDVEQPVSDRVGDVGSEIDIEHILDEIDDVLEANAEDFVRNYVQKGGE